ncbi:hypothetical protein D3OALGA1CA_4319 [Olavius algarvensis associated proteobacterium Delta 3]|nr:hypothetical protein D3OALGA1CA_4319 [Olavius algarvensis associated proteobacterium Delta 3]
MPLSEALYDYIIARVRIRFGIGGFFASMNVAESSESVSVSKMAILSRFRFR